jgi:hypothetical protein
MGGGVLRQRSALEELHLAMVAAGIGSRGGDSHAGRGRQAGAAGWGRDAHHGYDRVDHRMLAVEEGGG